HWKHRRRCENWMLAPYSFLAKHCMPARIWAQSKRRSLMERKQRRRFWPPDNRAHRKGSGDSHSQGEHLLHFRRVAKLSHAGTPIDPRNTAVLQEIGGQYFAIDPSLVDVGVPPPIFPLDSWIAQWPPDLPANEAPVRLRVSPKLATASNNGL